MKNSISGKTLRFTFDDGPMAKKTIEHAFKDDGSLTFKMDGDKGEGKATKVDKYEVATVSPDVVAVSYLGSAGYTLTVVMDSKTKKLVAFSSNDKGVSVQHGSFSEGGGSEAKTGSETMRSAPH
jgi:MoaF N-terminal domain